MAGEFTCYVNCSTKARHIGRPALAGIIGVVARRLQCAGINRYEAEDESSLRERSSDPLGLESCAGYREVLSEA
jgi:hypothetical protein